MEKKLHMVSLSDDYNDPSTVTINQSQKVLLDWLVENDFMTEIKVNYHDEVINLDDTLGN